MNFRRPVFLTSVTAMMYKLKCFTSNLKSNPVFCPNCGHAKPKHTLWQNQITICEMGWYCLFLRKNKDRLHRLPNVVFVHYQSLQIVVVLLQACLFGCLALSRTLLQQLQWLQQDWWSRLYTRVSSAAVWRQTVLHIAWGKGSSVFSILFPLKRRFGNLFIS